MVELKKTIVSASQRREGGVSSTSSIAARNAAHRTSAEGVAWAGAGAEAGAVAVAVAVAEELCSIQRGLHWGVTLILVVSVERGWA
ncbi:MAG: hypothetical protein ABSH29_26940 [Acidimicrobiales bacterium]